MGSGHFPSASQQPPLVPLTEEGLARLSPLVLAAGPKLDSREYKLMLDPAKFSDDPQRSVDRLWDRVLKDVIATRLDRRKNGEPRHKKKFEPDHERLVVFRDTEGCLLNANGYLLRERSRRNGDRRELTLKFRTPDIFLAAQSWIGGTAGGELEFEEDIAPLIRRTTTASGQEKVAFARPPTMRSMFSQSVTERIKPDRAIRSLRDVTALIPDFEDALRKAGLDDDTLEAPLQSGERVHELVFSGALVDLGENTDGDLDLTLWSAEATSEPMIAELSFKYKTRKGAVAGAVARRAMVLFQALQELLGDWASPERETKTSLALPESCRG